MVKAARPFLAAAATVLLATSLRAKDLSEYKIGDQAEDDIVTPIALVVVDPEATAALKAKEGERVPVVLRFHPEAGGEAVTEFHNSFVETRGNFRDAIEENFDSRKLDSAALATAKFGRLLVSFEQKNRLFPVASDLARLWASGGSDEEYEAPLRASLRGEMKSFIRATNEIPEGAKVGSTVRVVSCADTDTLTAQMAERHGTNHSRGEIISLPRAKVDLQGTFPPEDHAVARYLSSFLKPNCDVELELTIALRAKRAEGLCATESFAAGQIIAKRGQVIDQKTLAAIAALNERTAVAIATPAVVAAPVSVSVWKKLYWPVVAAGGFFLALISVIFLRRQKSASLLPARVDETQNDLSAGQEDWQQRAIAAERRADKAQRVIREGLTAHLARWMSDTLVQKLLLQRAHLIEAQQKAVTEVDKLGQRLDTIHSRMQGRLSVYEQRISQLEKELDNKDEVNRDLIQAEIKNIRRQMDAARVESEGGLN